MLNEEERKVVVIFISELLQVEITEEFSDDWCLRLAVATFFPSAPEPTDPLRFLRATTPQLPWPATAAADGDALLVCLLALGVRAEAKDVVIGKIFAQSNEVQETLRKIISRSEASDENQIPVKGDDQLRREIGNLRRQLEISNAENSRLKAEFRKRETILLQVVHSLGLKVGLQGLLDEN